MKTLAVDTSQKGFKGLGLIVGFEIVSYPKINEKFSSFPTSDAGVLRLTEKFHSSGRTGILDAGFGSVNAALGLKEHGVNSILSVKTHKSNYPKSQLANALKDEPNGSWVTMTNTINGEKLFALAWKPNQDRSCYYVGNTGTSLRGEDTTRVRYSATDRDYVSFSLQRPVSVQM